LEIVVAAAWTAFHDDKHKFSIPFVLDWSPKDKEVDYVKNWLMELACWNTGQNLARMVQAVIVFIDAKPCLAVFHKFYDGDEEVMKPKLKIVTLQSLKNTDLPAMELQSLFEELFSVGHDILVYEATKLQKVIPADENCKNHNSILATGIKVKDLLLKFSVEKHGGVETSSQMFCSGWSVCVVLGTKLTTSSQE
jgi:hypothetical protein